MGANIVRRRPPVSPPQPAERRETTQLTEQQLRELIFDHAHDRFDHAHDDLEAELELVDAHPAGLPAATPLSLPSTSSLRLAHTLRRAPHPAVGPVRQQALTTQPAPAAPPTTLAERIDISTIAMPRVARPANPSTAILPLERPASSAIATAMPCVSEPALAIPEAAPSPVAAMQELTPIDIAPSELVLVAGTPKRSLLLGLLGAGRAHLALLVLLLLALGAAALLLR